MEEDQETQAISAEYLIESIAQRVVQILSLHQIFTPHDIAMIRAHVLPKDEGVKAAMEAEYQRGYKDAVDHLNNVNGLEDEN